MHYKLKLILLCCLLFASCGSRKHAQKQQEGVSEEQTSALSPSARQQQPATAKKKEEECISARLRMELAAGSKEVALGGYLHAKYDDVIQLSITTFGIIEVARIELTSEYFMLIDKMGKQYVKAAYGDVPFLKQSKADFRAIQSYFWNEQTGSFSGWERSDFVNVGNRSLPSKHSFSIRNGSRTAKAKLSLSNFSTDSEWEKRTPIPSKYKEVSVDELLSRIMNLTL